jgi:hypothetical protein
VLGRPPRVAVDKTSGTAGVAWWINTYFNLAATQRVAQKAPSVQQITDWVDGQYRLGRTTSISDEEMVQQVRQHVPALVPVLQPRA